MHVFISAGEPSGDLHGANLTRALRSLDPSIECEGLGGERMQAAGCRLFYPLADHAVMGLFRVLQVVPALADLLDRLTDRWSKHRPDAVVLIDYPGFHWWVAARAKALGIPVVSFVPPQIWGWASHRVKRVRANFDAVLCSLPFEEPWYRARGVPNAHYIGHPYFDELPRQRLDGAFLDEQRRRPGPVVGLLPGSRGHEVRNNLESLISTARVVHRQRPDVRFLMACFKNEHERIVESKLRRESLPIEVHSGRTPEIIELAHSCVAVSGSVGLELLYRSKPTVVIYRTTGLHMFLTWMLKNVKYISLVNLLAGQELYPEFLTTRSAAEGPGAHILNWLNDAGAFNALRTALRQLRDQVAEPGACARAAQFVLDRYGNLRIIGRAA